MSREIKFRAWNHIVGRMSQCYTLEELHKEEVNFTNVKFMQFTGVIDNNGKEIFESDIVTYKGNKRVVTYSNDYGRHFLINPKDERSWDILNCNAEVIGNIHENPELIKKP